tara:strand:- start:231 stop:461 length:231 start_codon:yes stop_codon:yes gene_type:complete
MNEEEINISAKAGLARWLGIDNNNNNQTGIIEVYFESKGCAEMVATFIDEDTYIKCLPALELLAKENNFTITESIK